jgi:integrase
MSRAEGETWWLLRIAAVSGLRRAELATLHTDQVERIDGGWWLRIVGKGGVTRLVPIPDDVALWLRSRKGWAFPSDRKPGRPVLPPTIGKRVKRALGTCSTHTLRHRYATCAYQHSGDLLAVQQLLGHASPVTTQGYVMQSPERLTAAASATWHAA